MDQCIYKDGKISSVLKIEQEFMLDPFFSDLTCFDLESVLDTR